MSGFTAGFARNAATIERAQSFEFHCPCPLPLNSAKVTGPAAASAAALVYGGGVIGSRLPASASIGTFACGSSVKEEGTLATFHCVQFEFKPAINASSPAVAAAPASVLLIP